MKLAFHLCLTSTPVIEALMATLACDCIDGLRAKIPEQYTHILRFDENGLSLLNNISETGKMVPSAPTQVNFLDDSLNYRRQSSGKAQGIAKAIGLNKLDSPTVLDATAGLGKDSFILASLECSLTLLERSPIIHALLQDGFERGLRSNDFDVRRILESMTLVHTDALSWFEKISKGEVAQPDVIYLDPMFPHRSKSAKVKKDIALLQTLLGIDEDFEDLLKAARACAKYRVVVKRPGKKSKKTLPKPDFQIEGKSAHFDVFV